MSDNDNLDTNQLLNTLIQTIGEFSTQLRAMETSFNNRISALESNMRAQFIRQADQLDRQSEQLETVALTVAQLHQDVREGFARIEREAVQDVTSLLKKVEGK
jgi:phage host-nuclease inhibitor protein Gam